MASPQTAQGYTKIANAIMRALFRFSFSGQEMRLLLWVLRDSYGWDRKVTHPAPLSRIVEETGIPRATASWVIRRLIDGSVLVREDDNALRFNKNYEAWLLPGQGMLPLKPKAPARPASERKAGASAPSLEEVRAYCAERKSHVDADKFWHHFESTGWMKGKTKVTNWRAALCYWEKTSYEQAKRERARLCLVCEDAPAAEGKTLCQRCGDHCHACGKKTEALRVVRRRDGTKTAQCHGGCAKPSSSLVSAAIPEATKKMEDERRDRFMADHRRRSR
jgi:phage replication O-like protein O